jgi:membrane associated rhomboid family serine protease
MPNFDETYNPGYNRLTRLAGFFTRIVGFLIIANVIAYLVGWIGGIKVASQMIKWGGLTPTDIKQGYLWQFFTYMFLHGSFFHLLFNMFTLWMFGCEIERSWGSKEFLKYCIITGVGAGILSFVLSFNSDIPTIGASGAIFGILVAYALMFPNRLIYIWFLFPVKAKYLVAFFAIFTLIASFNYSGGGIAHFTHLGGMIVGYLYIKADWRITRVFRYIKELKHRRRLKRLSKGKQEDMNILEQVDVILDKINAQGIDSLTSREKKILEKASHLLSKR